MWHNVLAKLRHMGTNCIQGRERERGKSRLELLVGWLKHFGNLRHSAVKEVYMINVHQEGQIARDPLSS